MLAHLLYGATATRIAPRSDPGLESLAGRGSREACGPARRAVSRHGGDEFLVLLSEVTRAEDAALTANKILDAVSKPHRIGDQDVTVTVSVGIGVYPDGGADAETLLKNADTALLQAKARRRSSHQFFEPGMNMRARAGAVARAIAR